MVSLPLTERQKRSLLQNLYADVTSFIYQMDLSEKKKYYINF